MRSVVEPRRGEPGRYAVCHRPQWDAVGRGGRRARVRRPRGGVAGCRRRCGVPALALRARRRLSLPGGRAASRMRSIARGGARGRRESTVSWRTGGLRTRVLQTREPGAANADEGIRRPARRRSCLANFRSRHRRSGGSLAFGWSLAATSQAKVVAKRPRRRRLRRLRCARPCGHADAGSAARWEAVKKIRGLGPTWLWASDLATDHTLDRQAYDMLRTDLLTHIAEERLSRRLAKS